MSGKRVIIVGGVAAGMSAAAKARRCDESAVITVYERDHHVAYAGCGLPYHIGGSIRRREDLLIVSPAFFKERFNVEVRVRHQVTHVDPVSRKVMVRPLDAGSEYAGEYDELILATGATAVVPPIPGVDNPFTFTLRSLRDMDTIMSHLSRQRQVEAVIVGGGLIGIESAEVLAQLGARVTVVEALDRILPFLDWDMSQPAARELERHRVTVLTSQRVLSMAPGGPGVLVHTSAGKLPANFVLIATGVRPETTLGRAAGVELGAAGAIRVDEYMRTSVEHIWAAGDCADTVNLVTGERTWIPMGSTANKQGRTAGANAVRGPQLTFPGVAGTTIVKVMDLHVGKTGLSEGEARRAGLDPLVAHIHATSHAGYYPGAQPLEIKTVTHRDNGRLLGAQVVGRAGVDKRVDVLATAIYAGMNTEELANLDLAYAPPFSSARDPVGLAGLVAGNVRAGDVALMTSTELNQRLSKEAGELVVLDVRSGKELAQTGLVKGSLHLPLPELRDRLQELRPYRDREVVVVCRAGLRAYVAARILAQSGFSRVHVLSGGILEWHYSLEPAGA